MTKTKLNLTENEMNSQIHGKNIMVNVLKSKTCSYVIRWLFENHLFCMDGSSNLTEAPFFRQISLSLIRVYLEAVARFFS